VPGRGGLGHPKTIQTTTGKISNPADDHTLDHQRAASGQPESLHLSTQGDCKVGSDEC